MNKILSPEELKKKYELSNSIFFMQIYKTKKFKNIHKITEEEIFQTTETDFNQLILLFKSEGWSIEIPETILNECVKGLNYQKKGELLYELNRLKIIFKIENFDELTILRIEKTIKTYKLKNDIFLTSNIFKYFINELNAEKTEFYEELKKIKDETSKFNTLS